MKIINVNDIYNKFISASDYNREDDRYWSEIRSIAQKIESEREEKPILLLSGPSGSGKTTLLSLIGGIIKHSEGKVIFSDDNRATDITTLSESVLAKFRRQNIGFVFQDYSLIPEMTARQNITLPLLLDNKKL